MASYRESQPRGSTMPELKHNAPNNRSAAHDLEQSRSAVLNSLTSPGSQHTSSLTGAALSHGPFNRTSRGRGSSGSSLSEQTRFKASISRPRYTLPATPVKLRDPVAATAWGRRRTRSAEVRGPPKGKPRFNTAASAGIRGVGVERNDYAQVIEKAGDAGDHENHDQRPRPRVCSRSKDIKLAHKAHSGGNAGQRQQSGGDARDRRAPPEKAAIIFQILGIATGAGKDRRFQTPRPSSQCMPPGRRPPPRQPWWNRARNATRMYPKCAIEEARIRFTLTCRSARRLPAHISKMDNGKTQNTAW